MKKEQRSLIPVELERDILKDKALNLQKQLDEERRKNDNLQHYKALLEELREEVVDTNKRLMEIIKIDISHGWRERVIIAFLWICSLGFAWFLWR